MLFQKNDVISHYVVTFPHKQGAYAETYRVKDGEGKTRFLKLINCAKLNRHQTDDEGRVIEVEIAQQLNHNNLCRFIEEGTLIIGGTHYAYFVTEYISGETLDRKVARDGELTVYEIKTIGKAVLSALSFLHSLPTSVVHNEITMQNLLIDFTGGFQDLKVIDFGHARWLHQKPAKPDILQLNPFYMAPERFSGVSLVQSDLYAVGALMYQLLYGVLPWFVDLSRTKNTDKVETILTERDKPLYLPKLDKFELDDQLMNVIAKALCYDVEDRFQSTEDFIRAIDGSLQVERPSTTRKVYSDDAPIKKSVTPITPRKGEGFAAVAGMEDLKQQLREEVIEPLQNPEDYQRYGVTIPNGMLLYGPPGCGKTFFAKHFAEEVGFNFVCITPAALKSRYVNATQENIAKMFAEAEENAPTLIFIDEINELVPNRESDVHEMSRSAVNEMLAQMDRTGERGIFIIGATNYPHSIDPAILRAGRLDKKYYLGVPDHEARKALFTLYLSNRPYDFGLDYDKLAELTHNYVSADIQLIVNTAARNALRQKSKITMALLKEAIEATPPSLNEKELVRYETIKAEMLGEKAASATPSPRRKIGF